jgi:hypothetical protein
MATGCDQGHVTPKGVPLGVRMCNRKLHNITPQSGLFTGSDVSHVTPKGVPLGAPNQKLGSPTLFSGVFGYVV